MFLLTLASLDKKLTTSKRVIKRANKYRTSMVGPSIGIEKYFKAKAMKSNSTIDSFFFRYLKLSVKTIIKHIMLFR